MKTMRLILEKVYTREITPDEAMDMIKEFTKPTVAYTYVPSGDNFSTTLDCKTDSTLILENEL